MFMLMSLLAEDAVRIKYQYDEKDLIE